MLERAYANMIDLSAPISLPSARVFIMQGKCDQTVPYAEAYKLQEMIKPKEGTQVRLF